ncbi:MAG: transglycosylase domain-containing protein, partial [Deltaproteobacteria bacterium]|nr:transglycosylase domain-containing protein [Deltaproteobacteria bacterium]
LSESPVYYDEGVTPIGVFFEKTHSKYINYQDIPKIYIKAIIAAEDKNFFRHHGFDIISIMRAFISNLKAGRVIQGGSTITQQTAKNIFERKKKTYILKLKELIQALLLEKNYTKEEILEIYVNQFFVTGFGKGLGVASEYFFDKAPEDLELVEAAFLAGMVKGPSRYNPFTGKTDEEKKEAERLAKNRKDYVIERMKELNMITGEVYIEAKAQDVPFKEGRITYGLNVIMDYVRRQLESDFFKKILSDHGLENIATSGINIYTSVSQAIQEGALNSLRNRLPELDIQLTGYNNTLNKERYLEKMGAFYNSPLDNLPFFVYISGVNEDINNMYIEVEWENNGRGIIDYDGLKAVGEAWVKWKYGSYSSFSKKFAVEFMKNLNVGDSVPVMLQQETEGDLSVNRLLLWEIPEVEGGVIVLNNGMIKAMAGGFFDRHFNRSVDAKRQLGSIFKPIVYAAAMQLKWNNLDALTNVPDLYSFESTYYIPRPDHDPESDIVSMTWAGAKSENLASVWLLYHLTDRLNLSEFKRVTEVLGLARKESETYNEYAGRIRDRHGVIVDEKSLMEASFEAAKKDVESDLIFRGDEKAIENLNRLHFDIDEEKMDKQDGNYNEISRYSFNRIKRINTALKKSEDSASTLRDIWVDGLLPSWVIDLLDENIDKRFRELIRLERYDIEVLYRIRDFRTLVNLYYIRQLAHETGVSTPLDAVLSFPLGANSISILEAALMYNTIMSGEMNTVGREADYDMAPIITKITDRKGELIWEYDPDSVRVLSDDVSGSVSEILRMVVENGTGMRAKDSVRLSMEFDSDLLDIVIPCYGKTGTSNRFSNSSFAGFLPCIYKGDFNTERGYVIASYVGYDDNRPMKGPYMTVYGSSGALLLWIDTANAIADSPVYKKDIEMADLAFNIKTSPPTGNNALEPVGISNLTGLPLTDLYSNNPEAVTVYSNMNKINNEITLKRVFEPLIGVESDE